MSESVPEDPSEIPDDVQLGPLIRLNKTKDLAKSEDDPIKSDINDRYQNYLKELRSEMISCAISKDPECDCTISKTFEVPKESDVWSLGSLIIDFCRKQDTYLFFDASDPQNLKIKIDMKSGFNVEYVKLDP
jgi:hypothetical protein